MDVVRYLASVLLVACSLQGLYTAAVWSYARKDRVVDAAKGQETIFQTEARVVVYKTPIIAECSSKPQVIILGSSNANLGFRPEELQPLIGDVGVHNLAIGGQNMRSLRQIVDLIHRQVPKSNRRNLTFVAAIWYGSLVDDKRRWPQGMTDVDLELLRYGLFQKSNLGAVQPVVPDKLLASAFVATWPIMVPRAAYAETARKLVPNKLPPGVPQPWHPPAKVRDSVIVSPEQKLDQVGSYCNYMGPVAEQTDGGLQQLVDLAECISSKGGKLVVLDLPLPTWHSQASMPFEDYERRKKPFVEKLQSIPHVVYSSLQTGFSDDDFFDGVHPRPRATLTLSKRAAEPIRVALDSCTSLNR